jgi:hypothetical protein
MPLSFMHCQSERLHWAAFPVTLARTLTAMVIAGICITPSNAQIKTETTLSNPSISFTRSS